MDLHRSQLIDLIGSVPIFHGEREHSEACLCGVDPYLVCPDWLGGQSIGDLFVGPPD